MSIRVLLADDHRILREGLRRILSDEADIEVVGEAENGRIAVQLAKELLPTVVVMDLSMPEMCGAEAIRQIVEAVADIQVLVLSMHSEKRLIIEALHAGASGYLLKDCASDELIGAVRTVAADEFCLSPRIASMIIKNYVWKPSGTLSKESLASPLSRREQETLQLVAEGRSTKEIAFTLQVCLKTVESHRQNVMKKLNVRSVAELTKYAIKEGLTTL
jgi:DNA-binding NarL/FixJ family response regulator